METDFDELKIVFAQKQSPAHWQKKTDNATPVLSGLKTGYAKTIFVFMLTAIAIVLVDRLNAQSISTSVNGFRILLVCALYYALSKAYLLYRLDRIKPTLPVLQAIQELERYKKLNTVALTYGELLYAIVLSIGVYLYIQALAPLLEKENPYVLNLVLGAYILWVAIHTLVIKRRHLKKELFVLETYIQTLRSEH